MCRKCTRRLRHFDAAVSANKLKRMLKLKILGHLLTVMTDNRFLISAAPLIELL